MTEQEWRMKFADKLASMIEEKHITRKELAEKAGITEASLSFYFNCKKTPNYRTVLNLSHALGCSIDDLVFFGERID